LGIIQSLITTCKLHDLNPYTYLVDVLQRISQHPASQVADLTPRLWKLRFADKPLRSLVDPRHPDRQASRSLTTMRIEDMSVDQLLEMNRVICRRIDQLQDQENMQALSQLRVGSKVTLNGREGPEVGIVTKINRKSVIVLADDDMKQ
jgi:hypothetical protein